MYFMISNSDGDTYITPVTKTELLKELEDRNVEFLNKEELDADHDSNYWGENVLLIIKGEVIVPKPKEIIKSYEL